MYHLPLIATTSSYRERRRKKKMALLSLSSPLLLLFLLSALAVVTADPASGTIQRSTKQQIIASIAPDADHTTISFLNSPSSKYTALFLRRQTSPGAGGFGNDFCYVQVIDSTTGRSLWESDCAPVSTSNACSLVFTDAGIEVFDGSRSAWDSGVSTNNHLHVQTLELVDEGDMRIRDDGGNLLWTASSNPRANQECGSPGSPGLGGVQPPFASPIDQNQPFGQAGVVGNPRDQAADSYDPTQEHRQQDGMRGSGEPLVDYTLFNSGCGRRGGVGWIAAAVVTAVAYDFAAY